MALLEPEVSLGFPGLLLILHYFFFPPVLNFLLFKIWMQFASCCKPVSLAALCWAAPQGERAQLGSCCTHGRGLLRAVGRERALRGG